jgi:hypothetical protein
MRTLLAACLCLIPAVGQAASGLPHQPDPRTAQRFGPGYRYTQAGWTVVHIEGEPYARGVQHGRLLAPEIAAHVRCFATDLSPKAPKQAWQVLRTLADAVFLRGHSREYLEEMKGIAAGASAAGARFDGRKIDLVDIVALNAWPEIMTMESALHATPNGLEGIRFGDGTKRQPAPKPSRCSAFAATGPATRDGKIVFGHITMFKLYPANFYNIWLDIKPSKGHRVLMQSFPGGIHSGMDYYLNDAGLLVCETTIGQTRFNGKGAPLASRIRQAVQYADTIDKAADILLKDNNGLYTNEWLLGDIKTNEIAMLELGTHMTRLRRSSKDEWFGGTKGFYWGCNNTKDLQVRLETIASTAERPENPVFSPSERDKKWLELYDKYNGKMDAEFGKLAFTTPPLAAFSSVDAKFTTSDMAKRLESWALFGPPMGRTWQPLFKERADYPEVRPLVSNPWTVLTPADPGKAKPGVKVVDLHNPSGTKLAAADEDKEEATDAAWHGTLLPKGDADVWLACAFPAYERYVAREKALRKGKAELPEKARDKLRASLFVYQADYEHAARARKEPTLLTLRRDLRQNDWHAVAEGKGVLLLHALRQKLGAKTFDKMMDDFGTAQAGKETTTEEFIACAEKAAGTKLGAFFDAWLKKTGLPTGRDGGPFSVLTFYPDLGRTVIVYGTKDEEAANRAAARDLRDALLRRWENIEAPVRSDKEVTAAELAGNHVLLVGRPSTNRVAAKMAEHLPVTFGAGSVRVRDEVFAHADTAVLVAAENPHDRKRSVVVVAGLGAASTVRAAGMFAQRSWPGGEVVILQHGKPARALVVPSAGPGKKTVAGGKKGE